MAPTTDRQALAGRQRHMKVATHEPAPDYSSLVYDYSQIPAQHRRTVQDAALAVHQWQRDTIAIGSRLLAIKELLPHGQFEDWWQTEFALSERMVQSLLTVARVYGDPSNPRRVAGLSDGALYLLAAPSTPEAARAEVEERVEQGQVPTRAEVKAIISAYKATQRVPATTINVIATPVIIPLDEVVIDDEPLDDPTVEELAAMAEVAKEREAEEQERLAIEEAKMEPEQHYRMPTEVAAALTLPEIHSLLTLAKEAAKRARELEPRLYHHVTDLMPSISRLIHKLEQCMKEGS